MAQHPFVMQADFDAIFPKNMYFITLKINKLSVIKQFFAKYNGTDIFLVARTGKQKKNGTNINPC